MREKYLPSSLPMVSAVEIVDIRRVNPRNVDEYMTAVDAPSVAIDGDVAQHIADLWRRLPSGEQYRCHIPPFGLRFVSKDQVICQASICWRCNNAFGHVDGNSIHFEFDGQDAVSRELLAELQRIAGMAVDE